MALKISYVAAASCSKLPRQCPHDDNIFFFFSFADSPKGKADACAGVHSASVRNKVESSFVRRVAAMALHWMSALEQRLAVGY